MPLPLRSILLLALLMSAHLLASSPALAQHPRIERLLPGVEFEPLTPLEGYQKAKQQTRLLFIYYYTPGSPGNSIIERKHLKNPTLALYLKWHAVCVKYPWHGYNGFMILKDEDIMVSTGRLPRTLEPDLETPVSGVPGCPASPCPTSPAPPASSSASTTPPRPASPWSSPRSSPVSRPTATSASSTRPNSMATPAPTSANA